jgi:hypothetical protein
MQASIAKRTSLSTEKSTARAAAEALACFILCAAVMAGAVAFIFHSGSLLYYGDAEAHLDIARRVVDSRTPGWAQMGTTWLPLPHLLMLPLVRNDWLWQTGLAGAITSAAAMAVGATFLFAAMRRQFSNALAGAAAAAVFLLNPNALYLGSIPMTEAPFFAAFFALLYFTVRFRETSGWGALLGTAIAACAASLTRYEGWLLLPFVAGYIALAGGRRRAAKTIFFCVIAGFGPVLWLAHNWWYFNDALYFYRGPWSAAAIQGNAPYPGKGDWRIAANYFYEAARLVIGLPGLTLGAAGVVAALVRRAWWPVLLATIPPFFYIWSVHSSGVPIFVPQLPPHGWYNTRYALALLPLVAIGAGALVYRLKPAAVMLLALIPLTPFLLHPKTPPTTWEESEINSRAQRAWTGQAVTFLRSAAGPHETFLTRNYSHLTAVYRQLGVPIRDTLTGDNEPQWSMANTRPDLFLWTDWAVVTGGDEAQAIVDKARLRGPNYELSQRIYVKGEPVLEIYYRHDEIQKPEVRNQEPEDNRNDDHPLR